MGEHEKRFDKVDPFPEYASLKKGVDMQMDQEGMLWDEVDVHFASTAKNDAQELDGDERSCCLHSLVEVGDEISKIDQNSFHLTQLGPVDLDEENWVEYADMQGCLV